MTATTRTHRPHPGDVVTVGQGVRHWRVVAAGTDRARLILLDGTEDYAPTEIVAPLSALHLVERPR